MSKVVRAIIFQENKILLMKRVKQGGTYFTLVGGIIKDDENPEQALVREVKEETGLDVIAAKLVFIEEHPEPYNQQLVYFCEASPSEKLALGESTQEAFLNKLDLDNHEPVWSDVDSFARLSFRTPQLQSAISNALVTGFPEEPVKL